MGSYAAERYWPNPAGIRSSLRLSFNGGSLRMPAYGETYRAVSGRHTRAGFDYSVDRQRLPNEGPIPEGTYWVAPSELWDNAWYKAAPTSAWGNYRLTIHPFPETETYGRGGFFIHGGRVPGSAGCIDLWQDMDRFAADLRRHVYDPTMMYCILTVDYHLAFRK